MSAAASFQNAVASFRTGMFGQAEQQCRAAIVSDPNHADALHLLGIICLQTKRPADALSALSRAISLKPGAPDFHANLGHALRGMGKLDDAAVAYERAIQIAPDYALAHTNLGAVRRAQGRLDDAISHLRTATRLNPTLLAAWMNLGNAFREAHRADEANGAYTKALAIDSRIPDAHAAIGTIHVTRNRLDDAMARFQLALKLNPAHAQALIGAGGLHRQLGELDKARELLERAVKANPKSHEAHESLARVLWAMCEEDAARKHYATAMELAPSDKLRFTIATLIPPIYRSEQHIFESRLKFEEQMLALIKEGFRFDLTDQTPPSTVYLPYLGLEDKSLMTLLASLCKAPTNPPRVIVKRDRIAVGFISALFKDQTVGLWTQGLIAKLDRTQFEVTVISTAEHQDKTGAFIRQHADRYVVIPPSLQTARKTIADLALDVLIYTDIGMETVTQALAHSRLAPVQCLMWGHPVTSGIPTVDYFLSAKSVESDEADAHYSEKLVRLDHFPLYYYRPETPTAAATKRDFDLPDNANLYGCLQSQYKLHPSFDEAVAGILRRDPNGLILFSRSGTAQGESIIRARLQALCPEVMERVRFKPGLSRDRFRQLTALCNVLLAPFPFGAGDSSLEGFALGIPTITLPTQYMKGRLTLGMYREMQIDEPLAHDLDEYIELAVRFGTNSESNQQLRQKIIARNSALFENESGVRDLEVFLKQCVAMPRL